MAKDNEITADEIYQFVVLRLNELEATQLLADMARTIARGIVVSEKSESSKVFRELTSEEKLSVALEHIVASFDAPAMVAKCKRILGCEEIKWHSLVMDESIASLESLISDEGPDDALLELMEVLSELNLPIPELT